jgi:hypothetical protein
LHIADLIYIIFISLGYYTGWRQGTFPSLLSLIVILLGSLLIIYWLRSPIHFLDSENQLVYLKQAYPTLFFIALCLLLIIANKVTITLCYSLTHTSSPNVIDKIIGSMIGILKSIILLSSFSWLAELLSLQALINFWNRGWLTGYINPVLPYLINYLETILPTLQAVLKDHRIITA